MRPLEIDASVLARRAKIVAALRSILPGERVIEPETARRPYETDGLTAYRALPMVQSSSVHCVMFNGAE